VFRGPIRLGSRRGLSGAVASPNNAGGILLTDEFGPTSDNVVRGNYSSDNTHDCGITLASHSAAVDPMTGQPTGAAGVFDKVPTGLLVESGSPPGPALPPFLLPGAIKNTVIKGNRFFDESIGIFTLGVDLASTRIAHNVFGPGVQPISVN
jgi:hypothetical protein